MGVGTGAIALPLTELGHEVVGFDLSADMLARVVLQRPGPLSRVSFKKEDMVTAADTTAEHAAACQAMWDKAGSFFNAGPFTPFMFHKKGDPPKSTIQFPGGTGGVNWGGMAVDPNTGYMFVNAQNTSLVGWVEEKDPNVDYSFDARGSKQPYDRASVNGVGPFFTFSAPLNGYDANGRPRNGSAASVSAATVVEARRGEPEHRDDRVGVGARRQRRSSGRQATGRQQRQRWSYRNRGRTRLRRCDERSALPRVRCQDGQGGWTTSLEANANANPMSYQGKSGKQFVAVVAGNSLMVYSL